MDAPTILNQAGICFNFEHPTHETKLQPFEQLPTELIRSIFEMLSRRMVHTMHLVSTRFALLRKNVQYYTDFQVRCHNKYQSKELFNLITKERSPFVHDLKLKGKIFLDKSNEMFCRKDLNENQQNEMMSRILSCTQLKSLELSYNLKRKEFLKKLTQLSHLSSLSLDCENTKINPIGLLTQLRVLHIYEAKREWSVEPLTNLTSLETLTLWYPSFQLKAIATLTNLRSLNLRCGELSEELFLEFSKLTQLKILKLLQLEKPKKALPFIHFLSVLKLESLNLDFAEYNIDLNGLESQRALTVFKINAILDCQAIKRISLLTNLRLLNLTNSTIDSDALTILSTLQQLQYLNLNSLILKSNISEECVRIKESGVELFKNLRNITYLNLAHASVTDQVLGSLTQMSGLTYLNVSFSSSITEIGIRSITHLTRLTELNLTCNPIKNAGAMQLTSLSNLKKLFINSTGIDNQAVVALATSRMCSLKVLDIGANKMDGKILKDIRLLPLLRQLDLSSTLITESEVLQKLPVHKKLENSCFILKRE